MPSCTRRSWGPTVHSSSSDAQGAQASPGSALAALTEGFRDAVVVVIGATGAIGAALHPGTVDSPLSAPFAKDGLAVRSQARAADDLLKVIDALGPADSGGFFDYRGEVLPW